MIFSIKSRDPSSVMHRVFLWDEMAKLRYGEQLAEAVLHIAGKRLNLASADLKNLHGPKSRLPHQNFSGCDLKNADLAESDLSGADFSGADLRNANLEGAQLKGAKFCGAQMRGACLSRVNATTARFNGADLSHVDFQQATLVDCDFKGALVDGMMLQGANIAYANWQDVAIQSAQLGIACWNDILLPRWPIQVKGFRLRVVLLPGFLVIGAAVLSAGLLKKLTEREAIKLGGLRALRFHAELAPLIIAIFECEALSDYLLIDGGSPLAKSLSPQTSMSDARGLAEIS